MSEDEMLQLEKLIDQRGLTAVFDAISEICYLKAEHINANYGEQPLANVWTKAGQIVPNSGITLPS